MLAGTLKNRKTYYITLEGANEMTIYQGAVYNEPGYRAYDNKNNDLSKQC